MPVALNEADFWIPAERFGSRCRTILNIRHESSGTRIVYLDIGDNVCECSDVTFRGWIAVNRARQEVAEDLLQYIKDNPYAFTDDPA